MPVLITQLGYALFQSTHPVQGETTGAIAGWCTSIISIHSPHAGRDRYRGQTVLTPTVFQSTHPVRSETIHWHRSSSLVSFQSTHPVRGETRAGMSCCCTVGDFNPLTPCGVRLRPRIKGGTSEAFQSTHPVWGETLI